MSTCPYCSSENIEGVDLCEECGASLTDSHLAPPSNEVELGLLRDRVNVLSPKSPLTVPPTAPVGDVLRMMVERRIGCVVIEEAGKPVGIFSERDALRKLNVNAAKLDQHPVAEFMTPQPQTMLADAKIVYAVQRMDIGGYRHLPIVSDSGELVGIISARDIIGYLTEKMTGPTA